MRRSFPRINTKLNRFDVYGTPVTFRYDMPSHRCSKISPVELSVTG